MQPSSVHCDWKKISSQKGINSKSKMHPVLKATCNKMHVNNSDEERIIELPVIASVTRGLWRSVSRSSRTVHLDQVIESSIFEEEMPSDSQSDQDNNESDSV